MTTNNQNQNPNQNQNQNQNQTPNCNVPQQAPVAPQAPAATQADIAALAVMLQQMQQNSLETRAESFFDSTAGTVVKYGATFGLGFASGWVGRGWYDGDCGAGSGGNQGDGGPA